MQMPPLGAHMSITGGLHKAFERIAAVKGQALQIFSRNQRQWKVKPVAEQEAAAFADAWQQWGYEHVVIHNSYLINLATPKPDLAEKSVQAMLDEMQRAHALGVRHVVMHPGAHTGCGVEAGIAAIAQRLDGIFEQSDESVMVLLENTAGSGTAIGSRFEELAAIRRASRHPQRIGYCLDTCHAHAAGYALTTAEEYAATMELLHTHLGVENLLCVHLNDTKNPLGARKDRHEHIGDGHLGLEAFRNIITDAELMHVPMVLETDKDDDLEDDRRNLATLRSLCAREDAKHDQ